MANGSKKPNSFHSLLHTLWYILKNKMFSFPPGCVCLSVMGLPKSPHVIDNDFDNVQYLKVLNMVHSLG